MTPPKTPPEPGRNAALPNSQLELIYYIGKSSPNSLEVRGHPFKGRLYISKMWCPQGGGVCPFIYSPMGSTCAVGSNRLNEGPR